MRYFITSNFKNLSANWEKHGFYWEKYYFEPITNSVYTTEPLGVRKIVNKNINYLICFWA